MSNNLIISIFFVEPIIRPMSNIVHFWIDSYHKHNVILNKDKATKPISMKNNSLHVLNKSKTNLGHHTITRVFNILMIPSSNLTHMHWWQTTFKSYSKVITTISSTYRLTTWLINFLNYLIIKINANLVFREF